MTEIERRTNTVMGKERYLLLTDKISQTKQILFYEQGSEPGGQKYKLQIRNFNSGKVANDIS